MAIPYMCDELPLLNTITGKIESSEVVGLTYGRRIINQMSYRIPLFPYVTDEDGDWIELLDEEDEWANFFNDSNKLRS